MVAAHLNNTKVGGKRRSQWYETLWNIKYLPRFKWTHLNERLAYERAVHQQRMRTEIAQVKRETNFFVEAVDQSKKLKKKMDKLEGWSISQRDPEEEILKKKKINKNTDRSEFLKNLFKSDSTT
jgi:ESF2/ABP1 family protein